jgi:tetrahydromethanopterin S-methyltransferase subunit B
MFPHTSTFFAGVPGRGGVVAVARLFQDVMNSILVGERIIGREASVLVLAARRTTDGF